ncbi:MAG: hypothetical protein RBG13Loki_0796 [Promethearchaeota archaeon CR_4]|nr:MAG: hypothetical protein RBG13Loki_0796 [Candidatus Lokiarchaeota archaeon CR_4]
MDEQELKENLQILKNFNEWAEWIENCQFKKQMEKAPAKLEFLFHKDGSCDASLAYPDEEYLRSYILVLRMFIQRYDLSLRDVISEIYEKLPISGEIKSEFRQIREELNGYLEENAVGISTGEKITKNYILRGFIYGHYAHLGISRFPQIKGWREDIEKFLIYKSQFVQISFEIIKFLLKFRDLNKKIFDFLHNVY